MSNNTEQYCSASAKKAYHVPLQVKTLNSCKPNKQHLIKNSGKPQILRPQMKGFVFSRDSGSFYISSTLS